MAQGGNMFRKVLVAVAVATMVLTMVMSAAAQQPVTAVNASTAASAVTNANLPEFVQAKLAEYHAEYGAKNVGYAYAAAIGWGTGRYLYHGKATTFEWFAWTNSDALVQITMNVAIAPEDVADFVTIHDSLNRPYEGRVQNGVSVLEFSNDWAIGERCVDPEKTYCDHEVVARSYVDAATAKLPHLTFELRGMLINSGS
jgi:hypothetical protein